MNVYIKYKKLSLLMDTYKMLELSLKIVLLINNNKLNVTVVIQIIYSNLVHFIHYIPSCARACFRIEF